MSVDNIRIEYVDGALKACIDVQDDSSYYVAAVFVRVRANEETSSLAIGNFHELRDEDPQGVSQFIASCAIGPLVKSLCVMSGSSVEQVLDDLNRGIGHTRVAAGGHCTGSQIPTETQGSILSKLSIMSITCGGRMSSMIGAISKIFEVRISPNEYVKLAGIEVPGNLSAVAEAILSRKKKEDHGPQT